VPVLLVLPGSELLVSLLFGLLVELAPTPSFLPSKSMGLLSVICEDSVFVLLVLVVVVSIASPPVLYPSAVVSVVLSVVLSVGTVILKDVSLVPKCDGSTTYLPSACHGQFVRFTEQIPSQSLRKQQAP